MTKSIQSDKHHPVCDFPGLCIHKNECWECTIFAQWRPADNANENDDLKLCMKEFPTANQTAQMHTLASTRWNRRTTMTDHFVLQPCCDEHLDWCEPFSSWQNMSTSSTTSWMAATHDSAPHWNRNPSAFPKQLNKWRGSWKRCLCNENMGWMCDARITWQRNKANKTGPITWDSTGGCGRRAWRPKYFLHPTLGKTRHSLGPRDRVRGSGGLLRTPAAATHKCKWWRAPEDVQIREEKCNT